MEFVLELLKLILPAGAVFAAVFFTHKQLFDNQEKMEKMKTYRKSVELASPNKIQAYERIILFLERISPDNLAMRTQRSRMSARMHQAEMLKAIREEYEHNLTQQLYVSNGAWKLVKTSKEEVIRLINVAASKCGEESTAVDLSKMILSMMTQLEHIPTNVALTGVKKEFRSIF